MKTYKATANVKFDEDSQEYVMSKLESPDEVCYLCQEVYEGVIGKRL